MNKPKENNGVNSSNQQSSTSTSPAKFMREVRAEVRKVTWPTRKETLIGTIMVLVMTSIMGVFFLFTDQVISWVVRSLIG